LANEFAVNTLLLFEKIIDSTYKLMANSTVVMSTLITALTPVGTLPTANTNYVALEDASSSQIIYYVPVDPLIFTFYQGGITVDNQIELSCSSDGLTTFVYGIINNGGNYAPGMAALVEATSSLSIVVPTVTVDTNYSFSIETTFNSIVMERTVYITVKTCKVNL